MLRFFDCNTAIGRWKRPPLGSYETCGELEAVLDYVQVDGAVVYHAWAREIDPQLGNTTLLDSISGHPRLIPSWVLMPHFTGEMPPPKALVAQMLEKDVRVARLYPGKVGHRFSLEAWCAGPLLRELEEHRIPTFIDFEFFRRDDPDWQMLYDLCHRHPQLPIVITAWAGLASRTFYPLCQACPNLYIENSRYILFRGLEAFCREVSAERLLYGSGMPHVAPGVALTTITHAFISDEEKSLIASGNIERLMQEVAA